MKLSVKQYFSNRIYNFAAVGVFVTVFGIVMACYGFPKLIRCHIDQQVALNPGTDGYKLWLDMPFPLTFKVYIFNVTNPEDVTNGSKPILQEVGPYVYDQHRKKENVQFGENDTVTYELKKIFTFNQQKSKDLKETDVVTVANVALLGMLIKVKMMLPTMLSMFENIYPQLFNDPSDPFLRTTVGDLLFNGIFINCSVQSGMVGIACNGMKSQKPPTFREVQEPEKGFLFSMFHHMNNTLEGPYTINRGIQDISKLGQIEAFKERTSLSYWHDSCSKLNGTDSTIFAPISEANIPKSIFIFQPDVCRPMYAQYRAKRTAFGLLAYRYESTRDLLASAAANPDNACFCPENWSNLMEGCALEGVQYLAACQSSPVVASFPHFYLGSPQLLQYAQGLQPSKEKHQTFVDVEPKTGAALRGAKRLQFNMELINFKEISILEAVNPGLLPIMWLEEGAEINLEVQNTLHAVYTKIKAVKIIQWLIVATGIIIMMYAANMKRINMADRSNQIYLEKPPENLRPPAAAHNSRQGHANPAFAYKESIAHN